MEPDCRIKALCPRLGCSLPNVTLYIPPLHFERRERGELLRETDK